MQTSGLAAVHMPSADFEHISLSLAYTWVGMMGSLMYFYVTECGTFSFATSLQSHSVGHCHSQDASMQFDFVDLCVLHCLQNATT